MSNETEKICLIGMIEKVKSNIKHNEKKISNLQLEFPLFRKTEPYYNRPTEINMQIRKLEGEIARFNEVMKVLQFNEEHDVVHVHVDKTWIPETELTNKEQVDRTITFADGLDDN